MLVAVWRLTVATIVWNVSCGARAGGYHADVRQALMPGVFFGLNLAIFFAGATHNSVANAALIGSLAPFFIVPIGAWLFTEYNDPRALVFALVAFGGVGIVLFSAPPKGDASLEGNVFGFVAMLLLVAYVVSTRHFRQDMDVAIFMATICPIAAVAVLPLAIANGDVFGMSGTGWTYMLILTFTPGSRPTGCWCTRRRRSRSARSRSPRWFSLRSRWCGRSCCWARRCVRAGRRHRHRGSGLLAFIVINQRGERRRTKELVARRRGRGPAGGGRPRR